MARVWVVLAVVVVVLTVYSALDAAFFDRNRIRGLPKWVWIFVVILVPVIGPLLWLIVGRGRRPAAGTRSPRTMAPDDDPEFLKGLGKQQNQQERIRRLEQELADLDEPDTKGSTGSTGATGSADTAGTPPKKSDPGESDAPGRRDA
ncbi:PLD nuclease N-terminal domain-containing protein [Glaciibacter superstes]|uniref:PLD nuclease N-terminal domain-containing protein n=1 Tax=Glaciibacter superstes TaxID=501023 RepID=UPI0003B7A011|nr:PLD nuclease N-terminal domain-containing protein [Glaciibacter superstes]